MICYLLNKNRDKTQVLLVTLLGFFLSFFSGLAVADKKGEYRLESLGAGVYWHLGEHRSLEDAGRDDIANTGVVIGKRCVAVIDSGGSLAMGKQLLEAIGAVTKLPVCYVINTHIHYDHLLGNAAFSAKGTTFVGHYQLAPAVEANQAFFQKHFATELAGAKVIAPSLLVKGKRHLDLGGRILELQSWSSAHTHTDLTVYDPVSKIMWSGDLVFRERLPVLDGSLQGWLALIKQLQTLPAQHIIAGHGAIATNWNEALAAQKRYLQKLLDEVRAQIAEGAFLEEAMDTVGRDEAKHWQLFEQNHRRNVARAFRQLEWE